MAFRALSLSQSFTGKNYTNNVGYNQFNPAYLQSRNMATLKEMRLRIVSVTSIKKITSCMKMVATAKLKNAEKALQAGKPYWESTKSFFDGIGDHGLIEDAPVDPNKKELVIVLASDKGLCGSINSGLVRKTKAYTKKNPSSLLFIFGNKGKSGLTRECGRKIIATATEVGKRRINYADLEPIVEMIVQQLPNFDKVRVFSNKFISQGSFAPLDRTFSTLKLMKESNAFENYETDETDEDSLMTNVYEHFITSLIFSSIVENNAAELSARIGAMESASKNAGEVLKKLKAGYNRKRQGAITTELSEIISGAETVKEQS
jgi:F-type H+-transporting ATPase subunit gamma